MGDVMGFCGDSIGAMQSVQPIEGSSTLTSPLQLNKKEWTVANCPIEKAVQLVADHHYAKGASNTRTYLHGLYPAVWHWYDQCVGVAWWIPPTKSCAQSLAGDGWQGVLSLSRLVIEPGVPKNAATFLMSKSMKMIDRDRWPVLVTYADEWRGHSGAIYKACGWAYDGTTAPQPCYVRNGVMMARKRGNMTRTHAQMLEIGCDFVGRFRKHRFVHRHETRAAAPLTPQENE